MGEGEPAPAPPADTIKIFISGNSGSKEVNTGTEELWGEYLILHKYVHFLVNISAGLVPRLSCYSIIDSLSV